MSTIRYLFCKKLVSYKKRVHIDYGSRGTITIPNQNIQKLAHGEKLVEKLRDFNDNNRLKSMVTVTVIPNQNVTIRFLPVEIWLKNNVVSTLEIG